MNEQSSHIHLDRITRVIDEYFSWFSQCVTTLFYPDQANGSDHIYPGEIFERWLSKLDAGQEVDAIKAAEASVVKQAEKLLKAKKAPSLTDFQKFTEGYNQFINLIHRYERKMFVSSALIDPLTGLRTASMAEREFKRELDRVVRAGKVFSTALVRVIFSGARDDKSFISITNMIKQSIRSFDDAYILESGEVLLLLKQADSTGGVRALKRLKAMLDRSREDIQDDVRVLSCIAQPGEGDNFEVLINNMRHRLDNDPGDRERILEYVELSPLQKFMQQEK